MAHVLRCALLSLCFAGAATVALVKKTVPISGLQCWGGLKSVWVVYPDDGEKHPLVAFAHGWGGWNVTLWYPQLIENLAQQGYVVVSTEAGCSFTDPGCGLCDEESQDQIRTMEWALENSELMPHIDKSKGVGIAGQSMGGGACLGTASNVTAVSKYNIKAAVAVHPAAGSPANTPRVPTLYMTGSKDTTVSPQSVLDQYNAAAVGWKSFVNVEGATHVDSTYLGTRKENVYVFDMLNCWFKADTAACTRVTACKEPNAPPTHGGCLHAPSDADSVVV